MDLRETILYNALITSKDINLPSCFLKISNFNSFFLVFVFFKMGRKINTEKSHKQAQKRKEKKQKAMAKSKLLREKAEVVFISYTHKNKQVNSIGSIVVFFLCHF